MLESIGARVRNLLLFRIDLAVGTLTRYRARLAKMELGSLAEPVPDEEDMTSKIRLLVHLRYAVDLMIPAVILLLAAEGLHMTVPDRSYEGITDYLLSLWPNWLLITAALGANAVYHYLLRRGASLKPVVHAQVWIDAILFLLIIYMTGGIISPFAFLLTVPVLAASLLLSFRASLDTALFSTFAMGLMAWLQFKKFIPSERYFEPLASLASSGSYVIAAATLDGVLYFLIALSSGALARTIRKHENALARRAEQATMLYEVSSSLQSTVNLDEVLRGIMRTIVVRLDIDHALMYLTNESGDGLDLKAECFHPRLPDPPYGRLSVHFDLKREAGLTAVCALEKRAFNVNDPMNHPLINRELAARLGLNPFAIAPMLARGKVVGVIGIDRRFSQAIISQEEAQMLAVAANHAGLTIQNAALYERFASARRP